MFVPNPKGADAVKTALNAAKACCALLGMSAAFSVAVIAAPDEKTPPLTLVSTDTSEAFPFAAIQFNNKTYHVTEGDILDGVYIRHILPGRVILSSDQTLVAGRPVHPDASTTDQVARGDR
jgi:hypothetical protein